MSDPFQSGPPGNGGDDELPTVRVKPGSLPTPEQPGAFPPAPQPDFGAANQYPPAAPGSQPQPGFGPPAQPAFGSQPQPGFGAAPAQPAFGTPSAPAYGSQPQPGFGAPPPPQPGFGSQPQPGFGAPPQGYPQQPGFGAPPPQGYPPTQPNFSGPPPSFSGTQPPYGMPPQGYPQQPGFPPPGGAMYSPPKKRRGGLFAIIAIIVVVVLIVGVVGVLAFANHKSGNTPGTNTNSSSTPTAAATPTSSVPSGFQKFSSSLFSIDYPSDWTTKASSGSDGEDFTGTQGQIFQVLIQQNADQTEVATLLSTLCSLFGKPIGSVTTLNIGGQPWEQETCGNNGQPDGTVDATLRGSTAYTIDYFSLLSDFTTDKTQFYGPMEQSFAFGS